MTDTVAERVDAALALARRFTDDASAGTTTSTSAVNVVYTLTGALQAASTHLDQTTAPTFEEWLATGKAGGYLARLLALDNPLAPHTSTPDVEHDQESSYT